MAGDVILDDRIAVAADASPPQRRLAATLLALASCQAAIYCVVATLSGRFGYDQPFDQRPMLATLALLTACFALQCLALPIARRIKNQRRVVAIVLSAGLAFRAILLFTEPIQEVDIYRYLWDGAASAERVNPFRYSPQQVLQARADEPLPPDLAHLVRLREQDAATDELLERVHFGELTTVYPPVSQAVFAVPVLLAPHATSVAGRVAAMKATLLAFDVATIGFMLALLSITGRPAAWSLVYAWSPLVLKEFANSGHLDAIAVCGTTAALACWTQGMLTAAPRRSRAWLAAAGLLLGMATASKLYPIVLLPLTALVTIRRNGWKSGGCHLGPALLSTATLLAPMLLTQPAENMPDAATPGLGLAAPSPATNSDEATPTSRPRSGLTTFLSRWEMNDAIFLVVFENLRPEPSNVAPAPRPITPWFVVTSAAARSSIVAPFASAFASSESDAAFLLARAATLATFAGIAVALAWRAQATSDPTIWLHASFLMVAWFWALSPTMNPWYWTWTLPLLPYARSRAWSAVAGLVLLYYLRFWFAHHFADAQVWRTGYRGEPFFHFVVAPVEHGVWLGWLALDGWRRWRQTARNAAEHSIADVGAGALQTRREPAAGGRQ